MARFTRDGRSIYRDGEPYISIQRDGRTAPVDADEVAVAIVKFLNKTRRTLAADKRALKKWMAS
jgi:hypothetical protein